MCHVHKWNYAWTPELMNVFVSVVWTLNNPSIHFPADIYNVICTTV